MKKISVVLLTALLLTACNRETKLIDEFETTRQTNVYTVQKDETTAAAVSAVEPSQTTLVGLAERKAETSEAAETEQAEKTTSAAEQEYAEGEELLLRFLERLQTGEGDPLDVYDFMDGFTLDDYSYEYRGDGIYDVTLNCSDSTADMFPNGVSEWVFNSTYLTCFIPAEREENHNTSMSFGNPDYADKDGMLYTAYMAATDFSLYTGAFEADEEWFENFDITDVHVHRFYHAYNPYFVVYDSEKDEYYDVTTEEFAAAVKKMYNINMTAEQAKSMTDETGFMMKNCGHGGSYVFSDYADFEETEDEVRVTVDYYGDSLYFYPTIRSEYTFSKNEDGTITLQRVEKLFDRGYELASLTF